MPHRERELSLAAYDATLRIEEVLEGVPLADLPQVLEETFRSAGATALDLVREHGDDPDVKSMGRSASQVGNWIASARLHSETN